MPPSAAEWQIVIEEVNSVLAAADFYAYEKEQREGAWFIERCERTGETTDAFQRTVRESTDEQLKYLHAKLTQMMGHGIAQRDEDVH